MYTMTVYVDRMKHAPQSPASPAAWTAAFDQESEMNIDENGRTVLRAEDLPVLRSWILGLAEDAVFSDVFRAICRDAIPVFDRVREDDESTHAALKTMLEFFGAAAELEIQRHEAVMALLVAMTSQRPQRVH